MQDNFMLGVLFHVRDHSTLLVLEMVDELKILMLNLFKVRIKHFQYLKV